MINEVKKANPSYWNQQMWREHTKQMELTKKRIESREAITNLGKDPIAKKQLGELKELYASMQE